MYRPNVKPDQFVEGQRPTCDTTDSDDKENKAALGNTPTKFPPSTPATRLPLVDLIGNTDEASASNGPLLNTSPEDHIQWHPRRSPGNSQTRVTPKHNPKKRPRSSSPPSSQRLPSRHFVSDNDSLDLQQLQKTLDSQIDPAADLWSRYTVQTRGTPSAIPTQHFIHLLDASSPQSAYENAGSVSGLRRWTSCGVEWPSAKRKRPKVQHSTTRDRIDDVFADPPEPCEQGESKPPNIGTLVQRIQETLAKPSKIEEQNVPSSSSPLPVRSGLLGQQSTSPSRPETAMVIARAQLQPCDITQTKTPTESNHLLITEDKESGSSSFGSDNTCSKALGIVLNFAETKSNKQQSTENSLSEGNSAVESQPDVEDEFGDDEDISAADFEMVASVYDNQAVPLVKILSEEQSAYTSGNRHEAQSLLANASDDEFQDDVIDEVSLAAAEVAAAQAPATTGFCKGNSQTSNRAIQRYIVRNIYEGTYRSDNGQTLPEKVILVEDEKSMLCKAITLRQSWFDTPCTKGSFVHVIGEFTETGQCLVDDDENMLILHPDHLISATAVADSFACLRRAVLQDRIKATSEANPPLLYGTLLHEIFQEAMVTNTWEIERLMQIIEHTVERHIEDVYTVKLSMPTVQEYLLGKMPELQSWAKVFVGSEPKAEGIVKDRNDKHVMLSVSKLLDVEEHIWSPMYGLKGNIDATVQVHVKDEHDIRTLTVPFEIKTGKNTTNAAHRAQTALYTLLLADRYDITVDFGILYYLETSDISRIPAVRRELRHMIMQRNELACYVRERLSLPTMLKQAHLCNRCYAKTPCALYHKLSEEGTADTSGLGEKFESIVRHLKPIHQAFFKKWDDLLTKEESEMIKFRRELWTMLSQEREKVGRCFANVTLEHGSSAQLEDRSKINRFQYTLIRDSQPFSESQINVGEPIIVSDENGHYALAKGFVIRIEQQRLTVAVDRQLHRSRTKLQGFDEYNNQIFAGVTEFRETNPSSPKRPVEPCTAQRLRLDKDEFSNGMAIARNNLIQIMAENVFRAHEIRRLVVEELEPRFKTSSSVYTTSEPVSQMSINDDQRCAIEKILTAQDYALILGMPGTGKTTTIAHIIRALVAKGKSVLLASYTHTAVDNILLKIRKDNIGVLRLGATGKVHPEVQEFAMLAERTKKTLEQVEKSYQEPQVVATTCLGINHQIFNDRIFDYCIVDEASQITLPVCLGPIRMAAAFVLVGDHFQLPPLVQNESAREGGLDVSLFKLLSDKHPSAVVTLNHQYRMNEDIMLLSNTLIYNGRLACGDEVTAKRRLEIPNIAALETLHHYSRLPTSSTPLVCRFMATPGCWLYDIVNPSSSSVTFLDTDLLQPASRESVRSNRITNLLEASLTTQLVRSLLLVGVSSANLGVITLYRSQLALIKSLMRSIEYGIQSAEAAAVEAHTADRYQGRDKDVIIVSCVRSNEGNVVGDLLKDWRRVNVALTRARKKLIIIGSMQTLSNGDALLQRLVQLCVSKGWVYKLPAGVHDERAHSWNEHSSQSSSAILRKSPKNKAHHSAKFAGKEPGKVGAVTGKGILGPNSRIKRPVLADIINDALGDKFLD